MLSNGIGAGRIAMLFQLDFDDFDRGRPYVFEGAFFGRQLHEIVVLEHHRLVWFSWPLIDHVATGDDKPGTGSRLIDQGRL